MGIENNRETSKLSYDNYVSITTGAVPTGYFTVIDVTGRGEAIWCYLADGIRVTVDGSIIATENSIIASMNSWQLIKFKVSCKLEINDTGGSAREGRCFYGLYP
jgi:hypothetical protein